MNSLVKVLWLQAKSKEMDKNLQVVAKAVVTHVLGCPVSMGLVSFWRERLKVWMMSGNWID